MDFPADEFNIGRSAPASYEMIDDHPQAPKDEASDTKEQAEGDQVN